LYAVIAHNLLVTKKIAEAELAARILEPEILWRQGLIFCNVVLICHGSGCNFLSAVTEYVARGAALEDACRMSNGHAHIAIKNAIRIGRGLPVTNPLSAIYPEASRYHVLAELQAAVEQVSTRQLLQADTRDADKLCLCSA
jgi:hypothetical protein